MCSFILFIYLFIFTEIISFIPLSPSACRVSEPWQAQLSEEEGQSSSQALHLDRDHSPSKASQRTLPYPPFPQPPGALFGCKRQRAWLKKGRMLPVWECDSGTAGSSSPMMSSEPGLTHLLTGIFPGLCVATIWMQPPINSSPRLPGPYPEAESIPAQSGAHSNWTDQVTCPHLNGSQGGWGGIDTWCSDGLGSPQYALGPFPGE
jgi:hypothetical protein